MKCRKIPYAKLISLHFTCALDVTARIGKARVAFVVLKKHLGIWRNQHENQTQHLQVQCKVSPALRMQQKIQTFFNTCLRRIYKIRWHEKIRNEDLWERAGQEPVGKQILRRKWGWIGHTLRKPASSTTCQVLTWDPQGKRKRGRLRNSWRRDTEAELKQQGTNWTGMTRARMHHKVVGNFGSEADVQSLYHRRFRFNETSDVGACTLGRPEK